MVFLWFPHPFAASWWDFQPRVPQPTAAGNLPSDLEAACWSDLGRGSPTLVNITYWDYYCYYYYYYCVVIMIIIYYYLLIAHHNVLEQAWNKFDLGWLHPPQPPRLRSHRGALPPWSDRPWKSYVVFWKKIADQYEKNVYIYIIIPIIYDPTLSSITDN